LHSVVMLDHRASLDLLVSREPLEQQVWLVNKAK
jgi:hypothetical protein